MSSKSNKKLTKNEFQAVSTRVVGWAGEKKQHPNHFQLGRSITSFLISAPDFIQVRPKLTKLAFGVVSAEIVVWPGG